jgi:hypothetical protein
MSILRGCDPPAIRVSGQIDKLVQEARQRRICRRLQEQPALAELFTKAIRELGHEPPRSEHQWSFT